MSRPRDTSRRNAVIKRGNEYLFSFHDGIGGHFAPDISDAWQCDMDSKVAARIAVKVGGVVMSRNAEDSSLKKTTADSRERPATA